MTDATVWQDVLRRGEVLGAELDTDFRVLALTVAPLGDVGEWPVEGSDRRVQLALYPVGEFAAVLRRTGEQGPEVLRFSADQLPAIVALFEQAVPVEDPWPGERPNRGEWGPTMSLQGNSAAPDGRSRHLWLAFEEDDLRLDLHATFDDARLRDAEGNLLR